MARVLLFGALADAAGWRERDWDVPTISAARARLEAEGLAEALGRPGVQVALDRALTRADAPLTPGSELAFLPPMSGG